MLLSGLRGAIAFALSLKSVLDFPKSKGGKEVASSDAGTVMGGAMVTKVGVGT